MTTLEFIQLAELNNMQTGQDLGRNHITGMTYNPTNKSIHWNDKDRVRLNY